MPNRRKPQPRADSMKQTRAALIEAALEEFATHGLDASLDGICARAKLTRGAFYVHFADREALIVAAITHVLTGLFEQLGQLGPTVGGTARAIELFVAAARARSPAVHGGRALRFFHVMDACHRSRAVGERYRELIGAGRERIAETVALDQAAGRVRAAPPSPALAELVTTCALGVVASLELGLPVDLARLGATLRAVVATS